MRRCMWSFALVLALGTVAWGYHITGISVSPANPDTSDFISVTVSGWKPASNYGIQRSYSQVVGSRVYLNIYWQSLGSGCQVVTDYTYTEPIGQLRAGTYMILVRSYVKGWPADDASQTFTVSPVDTGCPGGFCWPWWPWWGGSSSATSSTVTSAIGAGSSAFSSALSNASSGGSSSSSSSTSQSSAW